MLIFYSSNEQVLAVVNMGRILINSEPRDDSELNVQKMHLQGNTDDQIMKEMMKRSYDRFTIELRNAQVTHLIKF